MNLMLSVAVGGALGSVARYLLSSRISAWLGYGFPWGTLAVNILGAVVVGGLLEMFALRWASSLNAQTFLFVGVLGGFTTFSAFSLDAVQLMQRGDYGFAALYIVGSMGLSIGALFIAMMLTRAVLA